MHLENAKVSQDVKSTHQSFGQASTRSKTIIIINTRLGQVKTHKRSQGIARTIQSIKAKPNTKKPRHCSDNPVHQSKAEHKEAKALLGQFSPSKQSRTQRSQGIARTIQSIKAKPNTKKPRHCPDNPVHQGKAEHKRSQGIARTIQSIKAKPNTKGAKTLPGQSSPSRQSRTQKKSRHCPDNKAMPKSKLDEGKSEVNTRARLRQSRSHNLSCYHYKENKETRKKERAVGLARACRSR
ncbi:unnamed protein product [Cochlearia groenlandica]